jgi:hypothetical protein
MHKYSANIFSLAGGAFREGMFPPFQRRLREAGTELGLLGISWERRERERARERRERESKTKKTSVFQTFWCIFIMRCT